MYLECRLTENKTIRFKLDEKNPVAMKYAKLVSTIRESGVSKVDYTSYFMWTKDTYPADSLKIKINESIKYFNENNGYGAELEYVLEVSQESLNKLHFEFEHAANIYLPGDLLSSEHNRSLEKKTPKCPDLNLLAFHLNNINNSIHALEASLGLQSDYLNAYFSTYLRDLTAKNPVFELEPKQYELFTLETKFGDLFLGYGTTGKNLFHVYKDNDVGFFASDNQASPQRAITANILAWFSEDKNHKIEFDQCSRWYETNGLNHLLSDLADPKSAIGYIKIGDYVKPKILMNQDRKEIVEYYSGLDVLDMYITC
jgi:hypothetical protein